MGEKNLSPEGKEALMKSVKALAKILTKEDRAIIRKQYEKKTGTKIPTATFNACLQGERYNIELSKCILNSRTTIFRLVELDRCMDNLKEILA